MRWLTIVQEGTDMFLQDFARTVMSGLTLKIDDKVQCEDCLEFFKRTDIVELIVTEEKLCEGCHERRKALQHPDDPYPLP